MPPLAGNVIGASEYPLMHHDAATDAGAQDNAENNAGALPCAIYRFRQCEAIGVVFDADLAL